MLIVKGQLSAGTNHSWTFAVNDMSMCGVGYTRQEAWLGHMPALQPGAM